MSTWNPNRARHDDYEDDEDSWEVRAFAEDAGNILGTTWPPRSYTCTFCSREFRSAQALGGHMNIHRRDRLRLRHRSQPNSIKPTSPSASSLTIPPHEAVGSGGGPFCFFYQLSNPNGGFLNPTTSPSAILSISPYPSNNSTPPSLPVINSPVEHRGTSSSSSRCSQISSKGDESLISMDDGNEKLDLELRLGHRSS